MDDTQPAQPDRPDPRELIERCQQWLAEHPDQSLEDYCGQFNLSETVRLQLQRELADGTRDAIDTRPNEADEFEFDQSRAATAHGDFKGQRIGRYKLLKEIGSGGMGTVWLAEQTEPVRRRVALKLIKSEWITRDEIARFEAERQALAMMDHAGIAKVLDAGTTDRGDPYFVMEYVPGIPITEFCDRHRMSIADRLQLFISVCRAVQHAHQKGIIHRDLKPSNILVVETVGFPISKVIDFGLAKALDHTRKLTDKTLFTEIGKVVGTLQYMSPEQAALNSSDIDTRTDVYSLGILLYELLLLTGSTPLARETLKQHAMLRILELIKEGNTPRPSHRLSSSGNARDTIGQQRQIDPRKLQSILRGELDWVVMKALEKDRRRRYDSATSLADDLHRFLINVPVEARPPSRAYQLAKFVRRNRVGVAFASVVAIFLGLNSVAAMFNSWRDSVRAEELSRKNEVQAREFAQRLADNQEQANDAIKAFTDSLSSQLDVYFGNVNQSLPDYTPSTDPLIRSRHGLARMYAALGVHFRRTNADIKEYGEWMIKSIEQYESLETEGLLEPREWFNYSMALENAAYFQNTQHNKQASRQYWNKSVKMLQRLQEIIEPELRARLIEEEAARLFNMGANKIDSDSTVHTIRAIELLESLDELSPTAEDDLAKAYSNRALELTDQSPKEAERNALRAIELFDNRKDTGSLIKVYRFMANIQAKLKNEEKYRIYQEKIDALNRNVESVETLTPDRLASRYDSALNLMNLGKVDEAIQHFSALVLLLPKAISANPEIRRDMNYVQTYWNRAELYLEKYLLTNSTDKELLAAAIADLEEAVSAAAANRDPQAVAVLPYLQIRLASCQAETDPIGVATRLDLFKSEYKGKHAVLIFLAGIYGKAAAATSDETAKQEWIDQGIEAITALRDQKLLLPELITEMQTGPDYAPLRADPRWEAIIKSE